MAGRVEPGLGTEAGEAGGQGPPAASKAGWLTWVTDSGPREE